MKTEIKFLIIPIVFILNACSYPEYLPKLNSLGEDTHGSYIKISQLNSSPVKGELISVGNDTIFVLTNIYITGGSVIGKELVKVNPAGIQGYKVYFAKPPSYEAFIPVLGLTTISHGYFLVFSLPINLIVTAAIASGARKIASYTMDRITLDQLRMFARYPQGIPPGIDIKSIK